MRRIKVVTYVFLIVVLISNVPQVTEWIEFFVANNYAYSNADGTFTVIYNRSINGKFRLPKYLSTTEIDSMQTDHMGDLKIERVPIGLELRKVFPNADTVVYRIFKKNPAAFWRWGSYLMGDEKYNFPYKDWNKIEKRRATYRIKELSSFQEF